MIEDETISSSGLCVAGVCKICHAEYTQGLRLMKDVGTLSVTGSELCPAHTNPTDIYYYDCLSLGVTVITSRRLIMLELTEIPLPVNADDYSPIASIPDGGTMQTMGDSPLHCLAVQNYITEHRAMPVIMVTA